MEMHRAKRFRPLVGKRTKAQAGVSPWHEKKAVINFAREN